MKMHQLRWASVLATASVAATWIDSAGAWKLNRSHDLAIASGAFLEAQWGEHYFDVPGTRNPDGTYTFLFVQSVEGYVVGHKPPVAETAPESAGPTVEPSGGAGEAGAETQPSPAPEAGEAAPTPSPEGGEAEPTPSPEAGEAEPTPSPEGGEAEPTPSPEGGEAEPSTTSEEAAGGASAENAPSGGEGEAEAAPPAGGEAPGAAGAAGAAGGESVSGGEGQATTEREEEEEEEVDTLGQNLPDFDLGSCRIENKSVTGKGEYKQQGSVQTYEDCRERCLKDDRCKWITYNSRNKRCYFKEAMGPIEHVLDGDVTNPKYCDSSCYRKNVRMIGAVLDVSQVDNAYICHFKCYTNDECSFFSYHPVTKQCELYSLAGGKARQAAAGFVTGTRNGCGSEARRNEARVRYPQRVLQDFDVGQCRKHDVSVTGPGEYSTQSNIKTLEACHQLCLTDTKCNWYTYNPGTKKCHLKSNIGPIKKVLDGDITSPKYCDANCHLKNVQILGNFITSSVEENVFTCHYACHLAGKCAYFTYHRTKKRCDLFTADDPALLISQDHISGQRDGCGTESLGGTVQYPSRLAPDTIDFKPCRTEGVSATGPAEYKVDFNVMKLEECHRRCLNDIKCKWYTYNTRDKRCHYKKSIGPIKVLDDKDITSPKYCNDSCFRMHRRVPGALAEIKQSIDSPYVCHYECNMAEACKYFTWYSNDHRCELFSSIESYGSVPSEGSVSGPKDGCGIEAFAGGIAVVP